MSASFEHEPPDDAMVAAYLSDRLDPAGADAFETYCLRHPEFARRVELDMLFKAGFRQMQRPGRVLRTGHRRRVILAMAAGIVLVVAGGLLLLPPLHTGTLLAYRSATDVPPSLLSGPHFTVTLIRVREGSAIHRIVAPRGAGVLALRVAPDSPPGARGYTVEVAQEAGVIPRSVTVDHLFPDARGYIQMYLPTAEVVGQTVKVTVNPSPAVTSGAEALWFRLQVVYKENPSG